MLGVDIFDFLDFLKKKFIYTEFLILTNGRIFSVWEYCKKLMDTIPDFTILGIPIHGSSACVHDYITRVDGSFVQTKRGIQNLLKLGIRIELRVVVSRLNIKDLSNIAKLIKEELEGVEYVSIMAMEMTGNAKKYQDDVWISYSEAFNGVRNAVKLLIESGIDVKLYNFPLCTVDKKFWTLCEKSISSDKVRYTEECNQCKQKDACGGVFAGTYLLEKDDLEPIL